MAKRSRLTRKIDSRVFTNTAQKTKMINLSSMPMRGGTRL